MASRNGLSCVFLLLQVVVVRSIGKSSTALTDCYRLMDGKERLECILVCQNARKRDRDTYQDQVQEFDLHFVSKQNIVPKIINGEAIEAGGYPWFARALIYSDIWLGCGGSLITSEYIMTAAHCVHGIESSLLKSGRYQVGALCAPFGPEASSNCGQKIESFDILEIVEHPRYNSSTFDNDFALIRLRGVSTITPVDIDRGNISPTYETTSIFTDNVDLWPIGLGQTESNYSAPNLMHTSVGYVKQNQCNSTSSYDGLITSNMMCASSINRDACQGDSGGALYDSRNEVVVGLVSWGYDCADPKHPGVYSRVSSQISWIQEQVCVADYENPKAANTFCNSASPSGGPTTSITLHPTKSEEDQHTTIQIQPLRKDSTETPSGPTSGMPKASCSVSNILTMSSFVAMLLRSII